MATIFVLLKSADWVKVTTEHTQSRVLAIDCSSFSYWAGASWSMADEITDSASWHKAMRRSQETCSPERGRQ